MIKLISWNVNGLRACVEKNFTQAFFELDADIFCLQETKLQQGQINLEFPGYFSYWNYAQKKGYSGTAVFTKQEPEKVSHGIGVAEFDTEGRVITLEYEDFYLVTVYTPNAQEGLKRIDFRMAWEDAFLDYLCGLKAKKSVIVCGDLNVAHNEIDLKNPKANEGKAGYSLQEREKFDRLLCSGFIDTFRHFHKDEPSRYSWWSYRFSARSRNAGWRIDYFLASQELGDKLIDAEIHDKIMGSDHCPVELLIEL